MQTPLKKIYCLLLMIPVIFFCINAAAFPEKVKPSLQRIPTNNLSPINIGGKPRPEDIKPAQWNKPPVIKGIYATGWMAGSSKWFPRLVDFIDSTELNALVIDVKDDTGTLSYKSKVPLAIENDAYQNKIADPLKMMQSLREHNIYPIARIVVFKDPFLARKKPEWAVKDIDGGLWYDHKGLNWIDPNNRLYWSYIIDIAKEAINLGFQEIQFDYVRFTSDGDLKRCVYPYSTHQLRQDVIQEFLKYARAQLRNYRIPISADIFGLTTSAPDDLGIGQKFEKIASSVDIVCPMVYPSHYALGTFGLKNPNCNPYLTVFHGVSDAKRRLDKLGLGNETPQIRPWLQDFSLGYHYGRTEIQKQIQAVKDAGVNEWIFWNPSCRYDKSKYIE
jgi:hypothetical protein